MKINIYGIILLIAFYLIKVIFLFKKPKSIYHHKQHKQMKIIELISEAGLIFFSLFEILGIGYKPHSLAIEIIWIIAMVILFMLLVICYIRYLINKRKDEYLYNKFLVYSPIAIIEMLIFLLSGVLLSNIFIIVFSLGYGISHIFISIKKNFE